MTLTGRIRQLEDQALTPRGAVNRWLDSEAHEFDCMLAHSLWLMDQPKEAWPLVRMPQEVVQTVRRQSPRVPDERLRDHFYQVQRDVLFLFFLHNRLNTEAMQEEEATGPRLALLAEQLRNLIFRRTELDQGHLENLTFPDDLRELRTRGKVKKPSTATGNAKLDEDIAAWADEERRLRARVLCLRETGTLLARRYFGREELLYAESRRRIVASLEMLAGLRAVYERATKEGPPATEEELVKWLIENEIARCTGEPSVPREAPRKQGKDADPAAKEEAARLARYLIVIARADALQTLGDGESGVGLLKHWLQAEMGDESSPALSPLTKEVGSGN
jgi:hypothetical protein